MNKNVFSNKSLSENRLGEGDSPILLPGHRKIGTVPAGSRIGSKLRYWPCLACVVLFAGCGRYEPPRFHSNMVAMNQQQIPEKQQQDIANILDAMFGTPDEPFVLADTGLDLKKLQQAAGPVRSDQFGRESGLYRRHCGHCHGTTGDGLGPTALVLNPYPRDYRQGKFKFKSTERPDKPTNYDLEIIVRQGVAGTAMPSFDLLPDPQIKALVEYVKYLSLRGETEIRLINAMADLSEGTLEITRATLVDEILGPVAETWKTSQEKIIVPADKPDIELAKSVEQGRELFYGTKANCVKCHGPSALGDGQSNDYDDWTKPLVEIADGVVKERDSLKTNTELTSEQRSEIETRIATTTEILHSDSLPVRTIKPRNLRQGVYRGGRAPYDIYRRLYAGINGVPMPGVGPTVPGGQGTLTPDEIWALVDYVRSLPYEAISKPSRQSPTTVSQARY